MPCTRSGDFSITGTLMRVENETYVIATSIGTLRIATDAVTCAGAACPDEPDVSIYANARLGEPVALKGASLMISGTLKAFENQTYTVETKIGDMTIPAMGVACEGPGCPEKAMVPATHLAPAITEGS
ncbi:MAG: hypothetical protein AAFY59_19625 [Pseudomonadota bacterium]